MTIESSDSGYSRDSADSEILDLSARRPDAAGVLEASFVLPEPRARLRVRLPAGNPRRAEALLLGRSWAAKHYWQESSDVVVYEFDEPLPAGPVRLCVPLGPATP
jgi:hypothetical protein